MAETLVGSTVPRFSPFLHPGEATRTSSLAVLHLRRDDLVPITLHEHGSDTSGYAEGVVTNTRFGSYPHSTIEGLKWGSQVIASRVDTGSRGRGKVPVSSHGKSNNNSNKRKLDEANINGGGDQAAKRVQQISEHGNSNSEEIEAVDDAAGPHPPQPVPNASTGFCHVLPPTPEAWTISLPHRTQVVYTPDYSFILQKLQARPGSVVIEAGAGSGSFTHAAARAVFNDYSPKKCRASSDRAPTTNTLGFSTQGRVFSFEYHEQRAEGLATELDRHGLSSVVQVTHRDVYEDGFMVPRRGPDGVASSADVLISPNATQIFLDLPAPWRALHHLNRSADSPLDPQRAAHICIFLPCIEQAQKAVAALRSQGWVEICMQDLLHKRLETRRERVGLDLQGLRGVNATPATVEEAIERLVEVERNGRRFQNLASAQADGDTISLELSQNGRPRPVRKADRLAKIAEQAASRKAFKDGRLVHRTEPEVKTHTSYLIFAVLPRAWTEEDEAKCRERWPPQKV